MGSQGWKLTPDQKAEIIQLYAAGGISQQKLGERFGVAGPTISFTIRSHRAGTSRIRLSEVQKTEIIERYGAGESTPELAAQFSVGATTVGRLLHQRGAVMRRCGAPQLPICHDALDVLTPDAAYWCGFIFTDGCVSLRRVGWAHEIIVALQESDWRHLVKLRAFFKSEHAISFLSAKTRKGKKGFPSCRWAATSERLGERLLNLGRYEGAVAPELAASRDFWRGVVDGDGSLGIYRYASQTRYAKVQICGSYRLLEAFNGFLVTNGQRPYAIGRRENVCQLGANGTPARQIVTLLYDGATTVLDRKLVIAQEIMGMPMPREYAPRAP